MNNRQYPPLVARAIETPYTFRTSEYINKGFSLIRDNVGLFVVFALVFFTVMVMSQFIPFLGPIAGSLILSPCLTAGFYLAAKKADDRTFLEFNDFFKGFDYVGPLALVALLQGVLLFAALLPFLVGMAATIGFDAFLTGGEPAGSPAVIVLLAIVCLLPVIYLGIAWSFAPLLVVFHKMEAWPALEASRKIISQQWGMFLLFFVVTGLLASLGAVALIVGLLFTVPAAMAMTFAAFRDIVGIPGEYDETDITQHLVD